MELLLKPIISSYHIVIPFVLFFFLVQRLSYVIGPYVIKRWNVLDDNQKHSFSLRCCSFFHCFFSFATIYGYIYPQTEFAEDYLDPYTLNPNSHFYFAISLGYFVWDTCDAIIFTNWVFFIHGALSMGIYFFVLFPFCQYSCRFFHGIFEVSTLILNIREVMQLAEADKRYPIAFLAISTCFVISFGFIRVFLGTFESITGWRNMMYLINNNKCHANFVCYYFMIANGVVMALQYYWFTIIAIASYKTITGAGIENEKVVPSRAKKTN